MSDVHGDDVEAVLSLAAAAPSPLLVEMDAHGAERSFPTVGEHAGRFLRLLARTAGVTRCFEFGSGFGYSAAWVLGALGPDDEIVLTDYDEANLDEARSFLDRHGSPATVRYAAGDALEAFAETDGTYEYVLLDHEKSRYTDAARRVVDRLEPGGLLVADNVLAGPVTPAGVRRALAGGESVDETTGGIAAYLEWVRDEPSLETSIVPLGEGLAVSRYDPAGTPSTD